MGEKTTNVSLQNGPGPKNMDQLNFKLNTDIATLTSQLMELEILGLAQQQAGNYLRCRSSQ